MKICFRCRHVIGTGAIAVAIAIAAVITGILAVLSAFLPLPVAIIAAGIGAEQSSRAQWRLVSHATQYRALWVSGAGRPGLS